MGIGRAKGDRKIFDALSQAVSSPLLETTIEGATGIIFNVKGGVQLPIDQVHEAADLMREIVDPDCNIIFGTSVDESLEDAVEITVIATGFKGNDTPSLLENQEEKKPAAPSADDLQYSGDYPEFLRGRFKETQEEKPVFERKTEEVKAEKVGGSKVKVADADIPPFLRKLRNK